MNRSSVRLAFRVLVTAVTLVWFIFALRPDSMPDRMARIRWLVVVPAFAVNCLWIVPSALRWIGIARLSGIGLRFTDAVRFYVIGSFFNAFLPTGNGGDVIRGVLASRRSGRPLGGVLGTVLTERMIGMAVSLAFVVIGGLACLRGSRLPVSVPVSAAALFLCMAAGAALLVSRRFRSLLKTGLRFVPSQTVQNGVRQAARVLDACRRSPGALAAAFGWSAANQIVVVVAGWMLTRAIPGLDAPFRAFLVTIPLSFVATLLPSIGGYGVREAGIIVFLGWFGVPAEPAAVFGFVRVLFLWAFALAGGVLYVSGWHGRERRSMRSALKRKI